MSIIRVACLQARFRADFVLTQCKSYEVSVKNGGRHDLRSSIWETPVQEK